MSTSDTDVREQYSGDDSTVEFAFAHYFADDDDLVVVLTSAAGVDAVKTKTTHYTVAGEGESGGGAVTMLTAPADGETLTIYRKPPATQETEYAEGGSFPAASHEAALDKLTRIVAFLYDELSRSSKFREGYTGSVVPFLPDPVASKLLGWNAAADALALYAAGDISGDVLVSAFAETLLDDTTAAEVLTTLGFGAFLQTNKAAANAAAFLTALGAGATGAALFADANAADARTELGLVFTALVTAADAAAARAAIGLNQRLYVEEAASRAASTTETDFVTATGLTLIPAPDGSKKYRVSVYAEADEPGTGNPNLIIRAYTGADGDLGDTLKATIQGVLGKTTGVVDHVTGFQIITPANGENKIGFSHDLSASTVNVTKFHAEVVEVSA